MFKQTLISKLKLTKYTEKEIIIFYKKSFASLAKVTLDI